MQNAAVLWTGGKDSTMAMVEASQHGYCVRHLVTFAPPNATFLAHPLRFIDMQARALALPHSVLPVTAPFEQSYETGLRHLRETMGIDCVVTGDIDEVDGQPNWIRERGSAAGVGVHTPLWRRDREALLRQWVDSGHTALISCVNTRWLDTSWIGRELNEAAITELRAIRGARGLDLCGEQGEYHTLIVDGPSFTQRVNIRSYATRCAEGLAYMVIGDMELTGRESRELAKTHTRQ